MVALSQERCRLTELTFLLMPSTPFPFSINSFGSVKIDWFDSIHYFGDVIAQILMEVSIQTHLQRGGGGGGGEEKEAAALVQLMNLALQSPRVPPFCQKHFLHLRRGTREGTEIL